MHARTDPVSRNSALSPGTQRVFPLVGLHEASQIEHLAMTRSAPAASTPARAEKVLRGNQLKQLREIFRRFDMDGDGSLTQLELAALLRSLGLRPTGDEVHALLAGMDADGNGKVEFDELAGAIAPVLTTQTHLVDQAQLLEVFRAFDRDGNGYISAAELARSMARLGQPLTFEELTRMMRDADADGDGVISFPEFAAIMAKSALDFLGVS
ncbi:probable calcium-binding protein CML14 [Phragmites australis]|uniref:probable calcium-binding protein CML14 n=1 Tax=Phragmites australis TaxID=29695 RepID=UPI002D769AFF|nr:probable calcium-binding protein CML14 [Phragmites australis]